LEGGWRGVRLVYGGPHSLCEKPKAKIVLNAPVLASVVLDNGFSVFQKI
jgi:hypothetical protein